MVCLPRTAPVPDPLRPVRAREGVKPNQSLFLCTFLPCYSSPFLCPSTTSAIATPPSSFPSDYFLTLPLTLDHFFSLRKIHPNPPVRARGRPLWPVCVGDVCDWSLVAWPQRCRPGHPDSVVSFRRGPGPRFPFPTQVVAALPPPAHGAAWTPFPPIFSWSDVCGTRLCATAIPPSPSRRPVTPLVIRPLPLLSFAPARHPRGVCPGPHWLPPPRRP